MKKTNYFLFDLGMATAVFPSWLFLRVKRHYISKEAKEKIKKDSFLIASNHVAYCDWVKIFLTFPYRRVHVFTLTKAFSNKFTRFVFKKMLHCIEVDDYKLSLNAFKEVNSLVTNKKVLAIFPQGHIEDKIEEIKEGTAFIAAFNKIPIVPIYIKKRKNFFHMTHVYVGERIDPLEIVKDFRNRDQLDALTTYIKEKMVELETIANK